MQILHKIPSARLKVCKHWCLITHFLKIVLRDADSYAFADGNEMQDRVGAATKDNNQAQCIFKCFTSHNVGRLDVLFQQDSDVTASLYAFLLFLRTEGWVGRGIRETHTQCFDRCSHRVSSVHSPTGPSSWTSVLDDPLEIFRRQFSRYFLAQSFKSRYDIELLSVILTGGDRATIYHDRRSVEPTHCHDRTWHVFIATGDGN